MFVMFFISALAETNRSPFDLPEGESEIVAGFFVEYSVDGVRAVLPRRIRQHDPDVARMTTHPVPRRLAAAVRRGSRSPGCPGRSGSSLKICFVLFVFIWVRATFPRFRYDQLMRLGWKVFLPLSLFWLVLTAGVLMAIGLAAACRLMPREPRVSARDKEPELMAFLDRTARSLLLSELVGGMALTLRYFFKPQGRRSTTPMRRARSARASRASTRCAAIPTARNAASPASCARRSARRRRSPSRPSRARTAAAAPRATTST